MTFKKPLPNLDFALGTGSAEAEVGAVANALAEIGYVLAFYFNPGTQTFQAYIEQEASA